MALAKLTALHAHLDASKLVASEKLDSWAEDARLIPSQQNRGNGLLIGEFEYQAIFVIEGFTGAAELLMAQVCAWLVGFDAVRDDQQLEPPSIDIDMVDEKTADVEMKISFREDIEITEDDDGPITLHGKTYSVANLISDVVDTVGVGNDQAAPTDQPYTRED